MSSKNGATKNGATEKKVPITPAEEIFIQSRIDKYEPLDEISKIFQRTFRPKDRPEECTRVVWAFVYGKTAVVV